MVNVFPFQVLQNASGVICFIKFFYIPVYRLYGNFKFIQCGVSYYSIYPVKKRSLAVFIIRQSPEYFHHSVVHCFQCRMIVLKKFFTQAKHRWIKVPVQFFLAQAVIFYTVSYYLIQIIQCDQIYCNRCLLKRIVT